MRMYAYLPGYTLTTHPEDATLPGCEEEDWPGLLGIVRIMNLRRIHCYYAKVVSDCH